MRDVGDADFDDVVLRPGGTVVVDFWAPWCGPCKAVEPALEQLAAARPDVGFVRLDIDANPDTANRYDVLSIPTVIVFDRGRPQQTLVGARPRKHYEKALAKVVPAAEPGGLDA